MPIPIYIPRNLLKPFPFAVTFRFIRKIPDFDIICRFAPQFYSPLFPKQVEGFFQILRIYIRCPFNCRHSPIFKGHHTKTDILRFQIIMELLPCHAIHALHFVPHHPAQQIDPVNALVHQCTAILFPGTAP